MVHAIMKLVAQKIESDTQVPFPSPHVKITNIVPFATLPPLSVPSKRFLSPSTSKLSTGKPPLLSS
jgi:hypothetical protein